MIRLMYTAYPKLNKEIPTLSTFGDLLKVMYYLKKNQEEMLLNPINNTVEKYHPQTALTDVFMEHAFDCIKADNFV